MAISLSFALVSYLFFCHYWYLYARSRVMDSDFAAGEDTAFVNDEISNIIKESIGRSSNISCSSS